MAQQAEEKVNDSNINNKKIEKLREIETPIEETSKLNKKDNQVLALVNKHFGAQLDPLYPYVVRTFITGYAHSEERNKETIERLQHYLKRYKEFQFDDILKKPLKNEENMFKAWPIFLYGYDKQGHPILYDEIGSCDVKAVTNVFNNDVELLRTYRYRFHRRMANCKRIQSDKYNLMIYKHTMVMDMAGFSRAHFGSNYRAIIQEIIGDEQNVFPETLHKLFIINAPFAFRLIWKILGTFVDPITYEKIFVLGESYLEEMLKIIDIDQIPKKYGGRGKLPIKPGFAADLPHDRYPLNFFKEQNDNKTVNN